MGFHFHFPSGTSLPKKNQHNLEWPLPWDTLDFELGSILYFVHTWVSIFVRQPVDDFTYPSIHIHIVKHKYLIMILFSLQGFGSTAGGCILEHLFDMESEFGYHCEWGRWYWWSREWCRDCKTMTTAWNYRCKNQVLQLIACWCHVIIWSYIIGCRPL